MQLAHDDASVVVRSQLACTAKRLPAGEALPIVEQLLRRDEDVDDVHLPLLLWWAIEDKAISDTPAVLQLVASSDAWRRPLVEGTIIERLARRFAAEGSESGFAACAKLLELAPTDRDDDRVLRGILQAMSGRKLERVPPPLDAGVTKLLARPEAKTLSIELALRMNVADAVDRAMQIVVTREAAEADRIALIRALGETRSTPAIESLLTLVERAESEGVHVAALSAVGTFNEERVADVVLRAYPRLTAQSQGRAIELLCSRRPWRCGCWKRSTARRSRRRRFRLTR